MEIKLNIDDDMLKDLGETQLQRFLQRQLRIYALQISANKISKHSANRTKAEVLFELSTKKGTNLTELAKLLEVSDDVLYEAKAIQAAQLLGIAQNPRRKTVSIEELAKEQNYAPNRNEIIGALEPDELDFKSLSEMIGK